MHRAALARLLEPAGQQPLAHALGVGLRDLAAQELDREAHAAASRSSSSPSQPSSCAPLRDAVAAARAKRLAREQARDDQPRRQVGPPGELLQRRELQVREPQADALRQLVVERVALPYLDRDSRCARRSRAPPRRRRGSSSQASTGSCPSRAAASASTPEPQPRSSSGPAGSLEQQLEAQQRRRVRARPEGPAGIDHDGRQARRRRLPGRPDPEPPATTAPGVERAPAVLPAVATGSSLQVPATSGSGAGRSPQ